MPVTVTYLKNNVPVVAYYAANAADAARWVAAQKSNVLTRNRVYSF